MQQKSDIAGEGVDAPIGGDPVVDRQWRKDIASIVSPEQFKFIGVEYQIRSLSLESSGKIKWAHADPSSPGLEEWAVKEGVIDCAEYQGVTLIVYNSHHKIPDGCRNLREEGRSGEYNPERDVAFVDLFNTYDFLNEKFDATWVQQTARHELRHGLVNHLDIEHAIRVGKPSCRDRDEEVLDPEELQQLGYLDELHSHYLDVLEGEVLGKKAFRSFEEEFYSIVKRGSHREVASSTAEGQKVGTRLFTVLQGFVVAKRMLETLSSTPLVEKIDNLSMAAASVVATERTLASAHEKVRQLWSLVTGDPEYSQQMKLFLSNFHPEEHPSDNIPELSNDLRHLLETYA